MVERWGRDQFKAAHEMFKDLQFHFNMPEPPRWGLPIICFVRVQWWCAAWRGGEAPHRVFMEHGCRLARYRRLTGRCQTDTRNTARSCQPFGAW